MFENLEHGTIKRRPDEDASFGLGADDIETAEPLAEPSLNNLAVSRRAPRPLKREEERRLIFAAQASDDRAMRKLIDQHVAWIRYQARLRWYRTIGPDDSERAVEIDDFVSIGVAEFAQRVKTWKPPCSLNTHYKKAVIGALADAAYAYRNKPALGGWKAISSDFCGHIQVLMSKMSGKSFPASLTQKSSTRLSRTSISAFAQAAKRGWLDSMSAIQKPAPAMTMATMTRTVTSKTAARRRSI
jgi:hypothetical protein